MNNNREFPDIPDIPDSTSSTGGVLGQILQRFRHQPHTQQAVTPLGVEANPLPMAVESVEPLPVFIRSPSQPHNGLCGKVRGASNSVWRHGSVPSYSPAEWNETRALEAQAAINARLDAAVAALPANHPRQQARLNVLANERGIVAGLLAKRDPILWGWLASLERLLERWGSSETGY